MTPFRIEALEIEAMQPMLKGAWLNFQLTRSSPEEQALAEFAARIQPMAGHDVALTRHPKGPVTSGMIHALLHALRTKTRRQQGEPLFSMTLKDTIRLRLLQRAGEHLPLPLPDRMMLRPLHAEESHDLEMQEIRPGIHKAVQTVEALL